MPYPTTVEHSKKYPATSIMADPYGCDPTGSVDISSAIDQLKADQANVGTMIVPAGTFLIGVNLTIPAGMNLDMKAGASFSIATGKVLTLSNPTALMTVGKGQIFSGNGKVLFVDGAFVRTSWFNGLAGLLAHIQGTPNITVFFDMDETIDTNTTVPANIKVSSPFGVIVTVADTITLTIEGSQDAGNPLSFAYLGSGNVVFSGSTSRTYVYPQMWNAAGNGVANDTTAMQSCFDAGVNFGVPVFLPAGTYLCSNLLYGTNAVGAESDGPPEIYGVGETSIIKAVAGTTGIFFKATNLKKKAFRNFVLDGNDQALVTKVFDTDYYADEVIHNTYDNVKVINYANTGWSAIYNAGSNFNGSSIVEPTTSVNQKALDVSGSLLYVNRVICDGYAAVAGNSIGFYGCNIYGVTGTANSLNLVDTNVFSNTVTSACVNGTFAAFTVLGGKLVTAVGSNHLKGTFKSGGFLAGTYFDGAAGENIFESSIAGSYSVPIFELRNCYVTANATLNYSPCPAGISVRLGSINVNDAALLDVVTSVLINPISYTTVGSGPVVPANVYDTDAGIAVGKDSLLVAVRAGGGGGGFNNGGGGGGGGFAIKVLLLSSLASTVNVTVGAKGNKGLNGIPGTPATNGGTSSFGAYVSASGGYGGTAAGAGGGGGVGTGHDAQIVGGSGADGGASPGIGGSSPGYLGGNSQTIPAAGNNYGGGGPGGGNASDGYDGAQGRVDVWEFPPEFRYLPNLIVSLFHASWG